MKLKYICIIFLATLSCQTRNEALETTLQLAGENRSELEKVLDHYSRTPADSLKLRAAEFLIANMPGHYTLEHPIIDKFYKKIHSDTSLTYAGRKTLELFLSQFEMHEEDSQKKEDAQHLTANYLIRHIDISFQHLNTYPWLQDIPFELFLNYYLPYRFANEHLDMWRDSLHISQHDLKQITNSYDKTKYTIEQSNRFSLVKFSIIPLESILRIFDHNILKDCNYLVYENQLRAQILGHPSAIEFLPYYANRNGFHYWHTTLSPEFKYLPSILYSHERKTPKVYRRTYSRNPIAIPAENEYIPKLFTDPFCKDVTTAYLHTSNVNIDIITTSPQDSRHAYLCVFNNLSWQPAAITKINRCHVKFKDMGKGIIYLPIIYQGHNPYPINYPFLLDLKGNITYLIPDTTIKQTLHLIRKYPTHMGIFAYKAQLENLELTTSNTPTFETSDTIFHDTTSPMTHLYYNPPPRKTYRYWCFSNNKQRLLDFAEILFITPEGEFIQGKVPHEQHLGFDNNYLTNSTLPLRNKFIIDFGTPVEIATAICIPRSDGNGIYPGDEYELFYHDLNGWQSLGRKTATDCHVEYDNVPTGALYWLHNHTTGIEERIFTIENGEMRFW